MSVFVPPECFKLGGRTWRVELVKRRPRWGYGKCDPSRCRIRLNLLRIKNNEELQHTFEHELTHAIASTMGWTEFFEDEDKIDALSSLRVQYERTKVDR